MTCRLQQVSEGTPHPWVIVHDCHLRPKPCQVSMRDRPPLTTGDVGPCLLHLFRHRASDYHAPKFSRTARDFELYVCIIRRRLDDLELIGYPDQLRERPGAHFAHNLAPMHANGDLGRPQFCGCLLVQEPGSHKGENFALARR